MTLYLTHGETTRDISGLYTVVTWSGDKSTPVRQLEFDMVYIEGSGLPVPEIGDLVTLADGNVLFEGIVLRRTAGSEDSTLSCTCFDKGVYLKSNDGTYKFPTTAPEEITRQVCTDRGIPVASLPVTGVGVSRKFAGVSLLQIIQTVWTLCSEINGKRYAIRWTPAGLLVKERTVSEENLVLKAYSNLMDATTVEDATNVTNSVAIYDKIGVLVTRLGDEKAQQLIGVMERHLTQSDASDAYGTAQAALEDGQISRITTVNVLGDTSLLSGETVVVRENKTGLRGIFWIEADVHSWKRGNYYTKLTLNCRNVVSKVKAGSELS